MTKLIQWLCFGILLFSVWISLVLKKFNNSFLENYSAVVLYSPLIFLFTFGVYAATIVLWRVYKFNDCEDAALELQKHIKEAKKDLKAKGFIFKKETAN